MELIMATSRSINTDRFYQSSQQKKQEIHIKKIKNIANLPVQPIKLDTTFLNHLKKAKSLHKVFEQQQIKITRGLQNNSLLNKLINVQPTIQSLRINKSLQNLKFTTSASNWTFRKKQNQKILKKHQNFIERCKTISNINVKDVKKKMQQEIKQYLQLKNSIRKIKPPTADTCQNKRTKSFKKISMRLPLWNDSAENREDSNNQEEKVDKNVKKNPQRILLLKTNTFPNNANQKQGTLKDQYKH